LFIDPIPVGASAPNPAYSFGMIKTDGYGSARRDASTGLELTFNHVKGNGKANDRHYMQLVKTIIATNPYTSLQQTQSLSASISITVPPFGFSETDVINHVKGLLDTLADADVTVTGLIRFNS
jgi:hypothetical protein